MRYFLILILSGLLMILSGCSTPSLITLNDGSTITTTDEPDFDDDTGFYSYKNSLTGQVESINKDQIKKIRALDD